MHNNLSTVAVVEIPTNFILSAVLVTNVKTKNEAVGFIFETGH